MGILDEIGSKKKERLGIAKSCMPLKSLKSRITEAGKPRDFTSAIKRSPDEKIKLIAEIKKASPSKGVIREKFDPLGTASIYEKKSDAISALTDEDFFQGRLEFIPLIKNTTTKPLLR